MRRSRVRLLSPAPEKLSEINDLGHFSKVAFFVVEGVGDAQGNGCAIVGAAPPGAKSPHAAGCSRCLYVETSTSLARSRARRDVLADNRKESIGNAARSGTGHARKPARDCDQDESKHCRVVLCGIRIVQEVQDLESVRPPGSMCAARASSGGASLVHGTASAAVGLGGPGVAPASVASRARVGQ